MNKISLIRPDDWHCHLRDHHALSRTVTDAVKQFHRAIVMPNLSPPITHVAHASAYRERIKNHIPKNSDFQPLMTLYLTETLTKKDIMEAKNSGIIFAFKLYPANVTTHSQAGVKNLQNIYPLLESLEAVDLPLLIHGEIPDPDVDVFDREAVFVERHLNAFTKTFPKLRMVLEHVSTKLAVDFVIGAPNTIAATITPHHLWLNRNQLLANGLRPHLFCLPIVKTERDQNALVQAAVSGNPKFFLGTDSAPHAKSKKESACCPAGIYTAHAAIELYAEIFEKQDALDKLEGFASRFGAQFYRLPVNTDTITLHQQPWQIPPSLPFGDEELVPFMAGENLRWKCRAE